MLRQGVDGRFAGVLRFDGDVLGTFDCGFDMERSAIEVVGAGGTLVAEDPWHGQAPRLTLTRPGEAPEEVPVEAANAVPARARGRLARDPRRRGSPPGPRRRGRPGPRHRDAVRGGRHALKGRLARAARAVAVDAGILRRRRELRLLIVGQSISDLGSMITFVAIPVQTFQLTDSSLHVGLLGVAEFVPMLALALVGGALADSFDRRRLVMIAELGALLVVGGLVVNSLLPEPQLWVLYAAAALIAACTAIRRPPLDALLPRLVERDELKSASALQWAIHNTASMAGPAIGGVLIVTAGAAVTYTADLVTFGVSLAALASMRTPPPPEGLTLGVKAITEGLRYAKSRQELVGTYLVDINAMFFGMPMALFPALAAGLRRQRGRRAAVRRAAGRRRGGDADQRLDAARAPARPRRGLRRDRLGRGDHRLRHGLHAVGGAAGPGARGRRRRGLRRVPRHDLERDDPRPPARTARGRRDDLVVVGPDARQRAGRHHRVVRRAARVGGRRRPRLRGAARSRWPRCCHASSRTTRATARMPTQT